MTEILIDTNVLVYAHYHAEPEKRDRAISVIYELQQARLGCLSIQCISEFFNTVVRGKNPMLTLDEAAAQAHLLVNSFPVFPLTPMIAINAMAGVKKHSFSYYDAQIWACAHLNQIPVVFSEDFSDGRTIEGVRFVDPFSEIFELEKWT